MHTTFSEIISIENLLSAWREFVPGKRMKRDVQEFSLRLADNILALHAELRNKAYRHGGYYAFKICDPKPRDIHKATVRDRLVHHAVYRVLYPRFSKTFVHDSFSCQIGKGTHRAINRFRDFSYTVSRNHTRTCWVLKCDIKKFFASIDQRLMIDILKTYIADTETLWLIERIVSSFHVPDRPGTGLPLGNLTSQLLINIYMNTFDQFVKHRLRVKYYIRYADDFVIMSHDRRALDNFLSQIDVFLRERLHLRLHPGKVSIKAFGSGIDFLGWVHFPDHRVLRTATKRRMLRRLEEHPSRETLASYRGLLKHGNTHALQDVIINLCAKDSCSRKH